MKDKKNLERLFQENFKDFEENPPEIVWKNIEEKLNEKEKKRRVIPIWWKLSGVAALLVFGTLGIQYVMNSSGKEIKNEIVLDEMDLKKSETNSISPIENQKKQGEKVDQIEKSKISVAIVNDNVENQKTVQNKSQNSTIHRKSKLPLSNSVNLIDEKYKLAHNAKSNEIEKVDFTEYQVSDNDGAYFARYIKRQRTPAILAFGFRYTYDQLKKSPQSVLYANILKDLIRLSRKSSEFSLNQFY